MATFTAKTNETIKPICCGKPMFASKPQFGGGYWCPDCKGKVGQKPKYKGVERPTTIIPLATPSKEQSALFDAAMKDTNIIVKALAGTGKTTSLVQVVRILQQQKHRVLCLSFARRDKLTMESRVPADVTVWTANGAALQVLKNVGMKISPENSNYIKDIIVEQLIDEELATMENGWPKFEPGAAALCTATKTLVEKAMQVLRLRADGKDDCKTEPSDKDWSDLAIRFNVEIKEEAYEQVIRYCNNTFKAVANIKRAERTKNICFSSSMFLVSYHDLVPGQRFDRVLVDECQDMNFLTRRIVEIFLAPKGKIVAVGDEFQAIYAWRGADQDSMFQMEQLMNKYGKIQTLPLNLCRRCPDAVIQLAKNFVPQIEGLGTNKGKQLELTQDEMMEKIKQEKTGLILCRLNAPLLTTSLELLSKGVGNILLRSNLIDDLFNLINNCSPENGKTKITTLLEKVSEWLQDTLAKYAARKNTEQLAETAKDKVNCIVALSESVTVKTTSDLIARIKQMFPYQSEDAGPPNPNQTVVLSTVHGAKGSEAKNVYILNPNTDEKKANVWDAIWNNDRQDRDNLVYVAITRSQDTICFVNGMPQMTRSTEDASMVPEVEPAPEQKKKKVVKKVASKKKK